MPKSGFKNNKVESHSQEPAFQGICIVVFGCFFFLIDGQAEMKLKCRLQLKKYGIFFPL